MLCNQPRRNIHRNQLLEQQLARIRNLHISKICSIIACSTSMYVHRVIIRSYETTLLARIDTIFIRYIEQTLLGKSRRTVCHRGIPFHLTKAEPTIARSTFRGLPRQIHHRTNRTTVLLICHHMLQALIKYWSCKHAALVLLTS